MMPHNPAHHPALVEGSGFAKAKDLVAVLPEWRGRAVDELLYRRLWENGRARGYDWAEAGWVLEDNHAMRNRLEHMGFRVYKTYRIDESAI